LNPGKAGAVVYFDKNEIFHVPLGSDPA